MPPIIPPSGLYYPNRIGKIFLQGVESVVGKQAFDDALRRCGLEHYMETLPPDNLRRQFDFADFSALNAVLDTLPQPGGSSLAAEVGRYCFQEGLKAFGGLSTVGSVFLGFQVLAPNVKIKMGLTAMAVLFTTLSDQQSDVEEYEDHFEYIVHKCPVCWGRHAEAPLCGVAGTMLEEGLYWATQQRFSIVETRCHARGDANCAFAIHKLKE